MYINLTDKEVKIVERHQHSLWVKFKINCSFRDTLRAMLNGYHIKAVRIEKDIVIKKNQKLNLQ